MRTDFDIVIVGGGIVGACTAALAASNAGLAGIRIGMIESQPPSMPPADEEVDLRVSAFSRASERILESFSAWSAIPASYRGSYEEMVVWDAQGKPRGDASIHFSAGNTSEPNLGHILENRRVLWAIYASRVVRDRVTLLQGGLANLTFDADAARVMLEDGRSYSTRLVIGSDGADSISRSLAGIKTSSHVYSQAAFVTHVATERPHERTAWQRFLPQGPIAFLPLADGRSSIVWTTSPDHAQRLILDPVADVEAQLASALDGVLGKVKLAAGRASFPLRLIHATQYCRERFVLIGDAAHTVHPLAGQGVNLGLLDAAALIETLGEAVAGAVTADVLGETRVLRKYERWRKSENTLALRFIDALNALFGSSERVPGMLRRWGLSSVDRTAVLKRFFMSRAMGTGGELPTIARLAHH
jgi:2-polyprenylphenol 6-hydroxylase